MEEGLTILGVSAPAVPPGARARMRPAWSWPAHNGRPAARVTEIRAVTPLTSAASHAAGSTHAPDGQRPTSATDGPAPSRGVP
jgi:hypothetical protein